MTSDSSPMVEVQENLSEVEGDVNNSSPMGVVQENLSEVEGYDNNSSPMGEVRRGKDFHADTVIACEGEAIRSIHPTGISKLTSSLRNSILPVRGGIVTGYAQDNLSEVEVL